jgi:hypothetical protein
LREPVGKRDGVVANQVALHFGYDAPDTGFTGDSACCVVLRPGRRGERPMVGCAARAKSR